MQCKGFLIVFNLLIFILLQEHARAQKIPSGFPATGRAPAANAPGGIMLRPNATIPASWYTDNLSGFCLPEWKLQKNTGIPLRLRLGSLEYVNRLEGKR
jgi:hypothetical protein